MKFSIITPSFNQVNFLAQTLESIRSQEGDFSIEHIIMDGGSTDGSVDLIKKYAEEAKNDPRLTVIWKSEKDRGQSDALNKGLRQATGDILAYINSDDYYLPGAFSAVSEALAPVERRWLYGLCEIVDADGKPMHGLVEKYRNALGRSWSFSKLLVVNYIAQPAVFWKRSVYDEIGSIKEDEHLVMDYEYWCRIGSRYPAVSLPRYVAAFRRHGQSKSNTQTTKQFAEAYAVAGRFTKNPLLKAAHKVHGGLILAAYKIMS